MWTPTSKRPARGSTLMNAGCKLPRAALNHPHSSESCSHCWSSGPQIAFLPCAEASVPHTAVCLHMGILYCVLFFFFPLLFNFILYLSVALCRGKQLSLPIPPRGRQTKNKGCRSKELRISRKDVSVLPDGQEAPEMATKPPTKTSSGPSTAPVLGFLYGEGR